jgi:hypothetical protein
VRFNIDSELSRQTYRRQKKLFRKLQLGIELLPEDRIYYGLDDDASTTSESLSEDDASFLSEDSDNPIFPPVGEWELFGDRR